MYLPYCLFLNVAEIHNYFILVMPIYFIHVSSMLFGWLVGSFCLEKNYMVAS